MMSRDARPRILIVDDEPGIRDFLRMVFETEGYRVQVAVDGEQALNEARDNPPDIMLTDLMMPRVDGWSLIERVRAERLPVHVIIAMSAAANAGIRAPDADLFLTKPFDIDDVLAGVRAFLPRLASRG
jgi:DNA-binding response OmpR family regulator